MSDEDQSEEVEENLNDSDTPVEDDGQENDDQELTGESSDDDSADSDSEGSETENDGASDSQPLGDLPEIESSFQDDILNDYVQTALEPIAGDSPCGDHEDAATSVISQIETTGDGIHEALRTAFGDAVRDDSLASFDLASVGRDADELVEQIIECLGEKCKSLILASYLPHLMLICHGPEGFDAGLTIFRELIQRYSDRLHPHDKEKLSGFLRRGVYIGNDDKVTDNYKLFLYLPITEREQLPYALLRNAKLKGSGSGIEGRYAGDAAGSSVDFYVRLVDSMEKAIESAKQANQAVGDFLGDTMFEIVSFSFVESMERMVSIIKNLATENCSGYPPLDEAEGTEQESSANAAAQPAAAMGEIVDREQAIELLRRIADFFHRTERHSPISYRIRDTIRWCKLDFPALLQVLLDGDESTMSEMQKRVGFPDQDSDSHDEDDE